jgi:hypothetical protein
MSVSSTSIYRTIAYIDHPNHHFVGSVPGCFSILWQFSTIRGSLSQFFAVSLCTLHMHGGTYSIVLYTVQYNEFVTVNNKIVALNNTAK